MASGPAHYREAEKFLAVVTDRELPAHQAQAQLAAAQVHATLALAAATGLRGIQNKGTPGETPDYADWLEATQ